MNLQIIEYSMRWSETACKVLKLLFFLFLISCNKKKEFISDGKLAGKDYCECLENEFRSESQVFKVADSICINKVKEKYHLLFLLGEKVSPKEMKLYLEQWDDFAIYVYDNSHIVRSYLKKQGRGRPKEHKNNGIIYN